MKFKTAGPIVPGKHYHIPPLERVPLEAWCQLVHDEEYFVVHAPRQSGKTSTMKAFRDHLNSGAVGEYRCLHVDVQSVRAESQNVANTVRTMLDCLAAAARDTLDDRFLLEHRAEIQEQFAPGFALQEALSQWAKAAPCPLVLLLDEIDGLVGVGLESVLYQLRSGYMGRPTPFPQSVVLCGLRNLKEYRLPDGTSPFNIAESLRLGDFTEAEVAALLAQHTEEAGQAYAAEAVAAVWEYTQGQPWLVNALAAEMCARRKADTALQGAIGKREVLDAKEALILRRATHLDQLAERLHEERVRRVIEPILLGAKNHQGSKRDVAYVRDLGLIAVDDPPRIANPIYTEVIPRELTHDLQTVLVAQDEVNCVNADGSLNMGKLLKGFQAFFQRHSEHWKDRFSYLEAGAQLVLEAYLQGKVNGQGRVEREYALGRGRVDLMVFWEQGEQEIPYVIECKMLHGGLARTMRAGLQQTARYMDIAAAVEGHLVIFDRSEKRKWKEKIYHRKEAHEGVAIEVWGA